MKYLLVIVALSLTGCGGDAAPPRDLTTVYSLPPELSKCTIYRVDAKAEQKLTIMYCPNSTVVTGQMVPAGKSEKPLSVVSIDGNEYVEKSAEVQKESIIIDGIEYTRK